MNHDGPPPLGSAARDGGDDSRATPAASRRQHQERLQDQLLERRERRRRRRRRRQQQQQQGQQPSSSPPALDDDDDDDDHDDDDDDDDDGGDIDSNSDDNDGNDRDRDANNAPATPSRSRSRSRRRRGKRRSRRRRNPGLVKKLSFVTHLLKTLDLVVFAELSALYYMECSMFRFLLRAASQYTNLTPKDESFPFFMPAGRLHVLLVLASNLICILLHLFARLPRGPGFHRGYQHGGLIIDFIGQRPPTYRLYYLLADVVILALQCLMLAAHTQREKLRLALGTFRPLTPDLVAALARLPSSESLDAEERGVALDDRDRDLDAEADADAGGDADGGHELRPLRSTPRRAAAGERGGRDEESEYLVRRAGSSDAAPGPQLSDVMSSGNAVIAEYHILHSLAAAAMDLERAAAGSLQTIGYGATMAALRARRRGRPVEAPGAMRPAWRPGAGPG